MILGIGIDIVEIDRIREMRERQGERFLHFCFTDAEIAYAFSKKNVDESLAARFAAKEAAMKAIGTGWGEGITFRLIEVVREEEGRPRLVFHGKAWELLHRMGVMASHLSLSHSAHYAIAQVVIEG